MIYRGEFTSNAGRRYHVQIGCYGAEYTINESTDNPNKDNVYFSDNPVTIEVNGGDDLTFIHINTATVRLVVGRDLISEFCVNNADNELAIWEMEDGQLKNLLFHGFIDPLAFNMDTSQEYNEIEIHASDALSLLNNVKVDKIIENGKVMGFNEIIFAIENFIKNKVRTNNIVINNDWGTDGRHLTRFISINTSIFFGDSEDDYMTISEMFEEILKYVNSYSLISYWTSSSTRFLTYIKIDALHNALWNDEYKDIFIGPSDLSIEEPYSGVKVECDIDPVDESISLIEQNKMYSDFDTYTKYMTEIICEGDGDDANKSFYDYVMYGENRQNYDKAYTIDNFCWIKRNDNWTFPGVNYIDKGFKRQIDVLEWLYSAEGSGKAAFISFGRANKQSRQDNAPIQSINMTDYFFISINGQEGHRDEGTRLTNQIEANMPLAIYNGLKSYNLIPADKEVTNYIVISGNVLLNPLQPQTGQWWTGTSNDTNYIRSTNTIGNTRRYLERKGRKGVWKYTCPVSDNEKGAYYCHQYWDNIGTDRNPIYVERVNNTAHGYLNIDKNKALDYKWSQYGDNTDTISKLPLIGCSLKIGNKYCVERLDLGEGGRYDWMTQEQCDALGIMPYFTIGVDIKIGDKIIGQSYQIQNNVDYTMNVDVAGTAIPITMDDNLSGELEFQILGPINAMWNEIERIHPSFWRSEGWKDHLYYVLEMCSSIMISDFKINFTSDNGLINRDKSQADNDLVYISDDNSIFDNLLETKFKIVTAPTLQECQELGLKYQNSNSYALYKLEDGSYTPVRGYKGYTYGSIYSNSIFNTIREDNLTLKSEEAFVEVMHNTDVRKVINDKIYIKDISPNDIIVKRYLINSPHKYVGKINLITFDLKDDIIDIEYEKYNKYLLFSIEDILY